MVGEQREGGRVRLRKAERGESVDLGEDQLGGLTVGAVRERAVHEAPVVGLDRVLAPLAAHRAGAPGLPTEKPASAMDTSSTCSWKMIAPSVSRSGPASDGWS